MKNNKPLAILFFALISVAVFLTYFMLGDKHTPLLMQKTLENNLMETGVANIVMTVYLNYRLFDTIFEVMLLLVCVMGVTQFAQFSAREKKFVEIAETSDNSRGFSPIMREGLKGIYPFVLIFGIYIILWGINSPGGGFQGGAVIAAIVMSIHLSKGKSAITMDNAIIVEKTMFLTFLVISVIFFLFNETVIGSFYRMYLIIVNIIIGIKVFCGFIILYLQFMTSNKVLYKGKVK